MYLLASRKRLRLLNEKTNELTAIKLDASEFAYYIRSGEEWFMEACLLYPYEINDIKNKLQKI